MLTERTSSLSPHRVASVIPGDGHGRIDITLRPGKTDPAGTSGLWTRDVDADLDAIQRWGAATVVSLIADEEFDSLCVRGLPDAERDRLPIGCGFRTKPITHYPDTQNPGTGTEVLIDV